MEHYQFIVPLINIRSVNLYLQHHPNPLYASEPLLHDNPLKDRT
jgi:hypothetical protein